MLGRLLFCVALCLCAVTAVLGGDWKRGRYGARPDFLGRVRDMPDSMTHYNHEPIEPSNIEDFPETFTWCNTAPGGNNRCTTSWNQHVPQYCGACFLHATLSMIQDRLKILKGGGSDIMLGRQTFLNCAPLFNNSAGCDGGDPIDVFRYMKEFGLPDETCMPYTATDSTALLEVTMPVTECPASASCRNCMPIDTPAPGFSIDTCWPVTSPLTYTLASYGRIDGCGEQAMMNEILHRGPIVCSIAADAHFAYEYRRGVYHGPNCTEVDHNVEVVGWGVEGGEKFWHVRNSWGTFWGEMGFLKVQRGGNHLMLEACDCWYAVPTWEMEEKVADGELGGTMYGVVKMGTGAAVQEQLHEVVEAALKPTG